MPKPPGTKFISAPTRVASPFNSDLRTSLRAAVGAQWGARVGIENECNSDTEIIDRIKCIGLTVQMLCNRIPLCPGFM
jgi:hypothetical protein